MKYCVTCRQRIFAPFRHCVDCLHDAPSAAEYPVAPGDRVYNAAGRWVAQVSDLQNGIISMTERPGERWDGDLWIESKTPDGLPFVAAVPRSSLAMAVGEES